MERSPVGRPQGLPLIARWWHQASCLLPLGLDYAAGDFSEA